MSTRRLPILLPTLLILACTLTTTADADPGDALNVTLEGRWANGPSYAVCSVGDLLYCGTGGAMEIWDYADESRPRLRGRLATLSAILDIKVAGGTAYLANSQAGLTIVDVSDIYHPLLVGRLQTAGDLYRVTVDGNLVYACDVSHGLRIVDVSDPAQPVEVGHYLTDCSPSDVAVAGGLAYVSDMNGSGLMILDVSDPTTPTLRAYHAANDPPWAVALAGTNAYLVGDYAGFEVVDVADPDDPQQVASVWMADVGYDIAIRDGLAFVANDWHGLAVFDVSQLPAITELDSHDTAGKAWRVDLNGPRAAVADQAGGLYTLDVGTVAAPAIGLVSHRQTPGLLRPVALADQYAYLSDESHGLWVVQCRPPSRLRQVGFCPLDGSPYRLDIAGDYAYVACQNLNLEIVDISDPAQPVAAARFVTPTSLYGDGVVAVAVQGDLAYVINSYWGLYIVDVTVPTSPVEVSRLGIYPYGTDVDVAGDFVYVVDREGGFRVIDVSNPESPDPRYFLDLDGFSYGVTVAGDYAYVARGWRGMTVFDVSDPDLVSLVTNYSALSNCTEIAVTGDYAYVADGTVVRVLDISTPGSVMEVGYYDTGGGALGVDEDRGLIAVGDWEDGIYLLSNDLVVPSTVPVSLPQLPRLAQNYPNPFNPRTTVTYELPTRSQVRLEVLTVDGRRVRTLVDEVLSGGRQQATWDGRDASGRPVAAGTYLYRLVVGGNTVTRGMVLLK